MSNQIAKYVFELQKTSGRLPFQGYLSTPTDTLQYHQRLLEQLREEEEEFYINNGGDSGELPVATQEQLPTTPAYSLWQFVESTGASLDGINLFFDSPATIDLVWGDGSVEQIAPNVNYSHTFS